ncbi:hypothetical protein [Nocardioides sp.]
MLPPGGDQHEVSGGDCRPPVTLAGQPGDAFAATSGLRAVQEGR